MMQGDVRQEGCRHSIFRCYETKASGKPVLTTMHCAYCGLKIQAASLEDCVAEWMKWKATSESWEIPWEDLDIDGAEDDGAYTTIISYELAKELADYDIEKLQEKKRTDEINRMARAVCGILHHDCEHCIDARYKVICDARKYSVRAYDLGYRKSEWISVEERLPNNDWGTHWKEREYYLVITAPSGLMSVATYGYKEFDWWVDRCSQVLDEKTYRKVTHWMPLPMPPKGGEG